jgi:hypothetical protein
MEEMAIQMPPVKKDKKLPVVLSKQECKELFKAPRSPQKHQTRLFKRHSHQNPPFGSVNPGSAGTYIEAPQATLRSSPICWWQLFFISV